MIYSIHKLPNPTVAYRDNEYFSATFGNSCSAMQNGENSTRQRHNTCANKKTTTLLGFVGVMLNTAPKPHFGFYQMPLPLAKLSLGMQNDCFRNIRLGHIADLQPIIFIKITVNFFVQWHAL
jgi:hypothetical protein